MRSTSTLALLLVLGTAATVQASPIKVEPIAKPEVSSSYGGNGPELAIDGNPGTGWVANGWPTQWIQLDLGRSVALSKIRLVVGQLPDGYTTHVVTVGQDPLPSSQVTLATLSDYTWDNEALEVSCNLQSTCGKVRYIRITTTASPSWVSWKEIEVYQAVEFFGFFADALASNMGGEGNNMAATVGAGANIVWIGEWDRAAWIPKLNQARSLGVRAILFLYNQFFSNGSLLPAETITANWNASKAIIDQYRDVVSVFYIQDEPYDVIDVNHSLNPSDVSQVAAIVKTSYADIPIAVIVGLYTLRYLQPSYISMFDWVGFDCYGKWSACYGFQDGFVAGDQWAIDRLNSWLSPNQRRIAVPVAYVDGSGGLPWTEADAIDSINRWHREIINNNYAMVAPFRWATLAGYTEMTQRIWQLGQAAVHSNSRSFSVFPVSHSASSSYAGSPPFLAFDSLSSNLWNSGGYAPAWVAADFGGSTYITQIVLNIAQYPSPANTTHILEGCYRADPNQGDGCAIGNWNTLTTFQGNTYEGCPIFWNGNASVTGIRVRTTASPSWVAWHDIGINCWR